MMRKLISICILGFLFLSASHGQQELGTYFLDDLHQSASLNPAFDAKEKIVIGLPAYYGIFHQRGLSISTLYSGEVLNLLGNRKNQILFGTEVSLLKVSIKSGNVRYNFAQNYRIFSDLQYSNPVVQLLLNGNASLVGGSATASPNLNLNSFNETLLGFSYHTENGLSFGANAKFINGIQNISTEKSEFELAVNDDIYQLDLKSSLLINSSFPIDFLNLTDINIFSFDLFPNNFGVALDLGFKYETELFSAAASILDIGYLRWKTGVNNYALEGRFQYDGVKFSDLLEGNFNFVDTISTSLGLEQSAKVYNKFIPARFYGNFNYNYTSDITIGALIYAHSSYGKTNGALALSAVKNWRNKHALGVQYAIVGSNLLNLGLSGYTCLGPVQLFASFDNIIGFFNPLAAQNVNGRVGINLIFGNKKITEIRA